jgi:hypothetical protein
MTMRVARFAALLAVAALVGTVHASADSGAPTGLHAFLLRADEPALTAFSRTPSFAWNPVPGAQHYEFQLSLSTSFRDNSIVFADLNVLSPVEAPGITLPWITGNPHSLYARVRAVTATGDSPWSSNFGFDMVAPAAPKPLPSTANGLIRWSPVEGARLYEIWFVDIPKFVVVSTNVIDEREFYTFHQSSTWTGTVRWRIRALRSDVQLGGNSGTTRYNKIPAVQYGPWSSVYSSSNTAFTGGPIKLGSTVSDVTSDGSANSPAHKLMPAFTWTGNQTLSGKAAELYRVYVFSDKECINPVFIGSVVGSPAYAPRPYGSLTLPTSLAGIASARYNYLTDGTEPASYMNDFTQVTPNEDQPHVTPQATVAGTPGDNGSASSGGGSPSGGSSSGGGASSSGSVTWSGDFGAPVDLWDTDWPSSGYYWTVIPVEAYSPGALQSTVVAPGAPLGSTTLPLASTAGFNVGDSITIGTGPSQESAVVAAVSATSLTLGAKLTNNHGAGELVARSGGSIVYHDMELPQDACAAGRESRFGKSSEPALTSEGDLFATGLSSTGRLTSALHTTQFYGPPLVSWTPALGAEEYEIQWSKTSYPFKAELIPGGASAGMLAITTSAVLPLTAGTWYYRVRGYDFSLPTGVQQMGWSDPVKIVVSKPTFKIVAGKQNKFKIVGNGK